MDQDSDGIKQPSLRPLNIPPGTTRAGDLHQPQSLSPAATPATSGKGSGIDRDVLLTGAGCVLILFAGLLIAGVFALRAIKDKQAPVPPTVPVAAVGSVPTDTPEPTRTPTPTAVSPYTPLPTWTPMGTKQQVSDYRGHDAEYHDDVVKVDDFMQQSITDVDTLLHYRAESLTPPRRIGRHLALFDCINCDKCLPACPNDANFAYEVGPVALEYQSYRVEGGRVDASDGGRFEVRERHQIATFQDFCNDCGNCDTFCPEDGGPYLEKPRFFGSLAAWQRLAERDGFYVERGEGTVAMWGRIRGVAYRLEVDRTKTRPSSRTAA